MEQQMLAMIGKGNLHLRRLLRHHVISNRDIAEKIIIIGGKRQDIGGA